jgi:hypothetical protein
MLFTIYVMHEPCQCRDDIREEACVPFKVRGFMIIRKENEFIIDVQL